MTTNTKQSKPCAAAQAVDRVCPKHGVARVSERVDGTGQEFSFCPVCNEENEKAARELEERERNARIVAGIPPHYRAADLNQFDGGVIAPAIEWAMAPRGFLYVTGKAGVGKTHLACAVKKSLNVRGIYSQLVFSGEMFLSLRKTFGKNSSDSEADIVSKYASDRATVIFDDVGAQKISEYTVDAWFNIIDRRYRADAPTMITTNLSPAELAEALSLRVQSRICSGLTLTLCGKDRRHKEHWTDRY